MTSARVIRTEYVVMRREVRENWEGKILIGEWEMMGSAATVEQCYADIIGPAYPADYDGVTVFPERVRVRRRDPANPHLRPYDEAAIFESFVRADGSWSLGALVENF